MDKESKINEYFDVASLMSNYIVASSLDEYFINNCFEFKIPNTSEWIIGNEKIGKLKQRIEQGIVVESQKTGFRPTTRDRRPIVGFAKDNDLLGVFGGLGSKGVLLAPYFSKLFASVLSEGTSIPKEVSAARF